jgi:hypothetical protein
MMRETPYQCTAFRETERKDSVLTERNEEEESNRLSNIMICYVTKQNDRINENNSNCRHIHRDEVF